ncbi:LOW QUALITY PROTEIN: hypothetical protein HID58_040822 [Brassica napus]|uniref:Uncharacterized protein n=1 Tax=Brassica napus TaxID=3708 RepID=A0ABQ8B943_BRANA|nr:LOW QUALITY PROTEIN: hypothetical protein HID58_040822 [Brassica napus]
MPSRCLLLKTKKKSKVDLPENGEKSEVEKKIINESDPLYGVLEEHQVGVIPMTGRPKFCKGRAGWHETEKMAREERVKISLRDLENDLMGHMTMLRLELPH